MAKRRNIKKVTMTVGVWEYNPMVETDNNGTKNYTLGDVTTCYWPCLISEDAKQDVYAELSEGLPIANLRYCGTEDITYCIPVDELNKYPHQIAVKRGSETE